VLNTLDTSQKFDLTFTKGVLIHINPDMLHKVYQNLYDLSDRYIMVCEYYNPAPVSIEYRGNKERLFKRDFAGELIQKFDLKLIDYGFNYQHDHYLTNDDSTWFLLSKF
jgi:pseudaminic acid biosynthesis-associated methylase